MAFFDLISEPEKRLFLSLTEVNDETCWGVAINKIIAEPEVKRWKLLVKSLKSQAKDCDETMQNIIGERSLTLLKAV